MVICGAVAERMGDHGCGFSARLTIKSIYLPSCVAVLVIRVRNANGMMTCGGADSDFVCFQSLTFEVKSFNLRSQTGIFGRFSRFLYVIHLLRKTTTLAVVGVNKRSNAYFCLISEEDRR
jgi:hypothetical protein